MVAAVKHHTFGSNMINRERIKRNFKGIKSMIPHGWKITRTGSAGLIVTSMTGDDTYILYWSRKHMLEANTI